MAYSKDLSNAEYTPLSKTHGYNYQVHKKQLNFQARDFIEKAVDFYHDGKFYRYSTSSNQAKDVPEGTVRGDTIYSMTKMWRDQLTGKIMLQVINHQDFKA